MRCDRTAEVTWQQGVAHCPPEVACCEVLENFKVLAWMTAVPAQALFQLHEKACFVSDCCSLWWLSAHPFKQGSNLRVLNAVSFIDAETSVAKHTAVKKAQLILSAQDLLNGHNSANIMPTDSFKSP